MQMTYVDMQIRMSIFLSRIRPWVVVRFGQCVASSTYYDTFSLIHFSSICLTFRPIVRSRFVTYTFWAVTTQALPTQSEVLPAPFDSLFIYLIITFAIVQDSILLIKSIHDNVCLNISEMMQVLHNSYWTAIP